MAGVKANGDPPQIDPPVDVNIVKVIGQLKKLADYREGRTRKTNQRHVTIQDLIDAGLIADGDII